MMIAVFVVVIAILDWIVMVLKMDQHIIINEENVFITQKMIVHRIAMVFSVVLLNMIVQVSAVVMPQKIAKELVTALQ